MEGEWPGLHHPGDINHVAVQGQDVGKSGEDGIEGAIHLGSLSVHDVGLDLAQPVAHRAHAALVEGAHPSQLGHAERVEEDVCPDLFRGLQGAPGAGDDVDLNLPVLLQTVQQRLRGGAKMGIGVGIIPCVFPVIRGDDGDFHRGRRHGRGYAQAPGAGVAMM